MEYMMSQIQCIKAKKTWNDLPSEIKKNFNNEEQKWKEFVINFCFSNQMSYRSSSVSFYILKDDAYYQQLLQYSRTNLLLYPYHLQTRIVRLFNITPFKYYCDMLNEQFLKERSYDTIPNFTANDCLQLLGIGRNQYIDIAIENKSNKSWSLIKKSFKGFLPKKSRIWDNWQPWWFVKVGTILISDMESFNNMEREIIDSLIDKHGSDCGEYDKEILLSLYCNNYLIFDVPVHDEDRFTVPKLESFVMNRIQGDYMESLMYKIIVTLDEKTSLTDLSTLLDADIILIKQAVSLFCRLGLIHKKNLIVDFSSLHSSWLPFVSKLAAKESLKRNSIPNENVGFNLSSDSHSLADSQTENFKRIGFIYDSTLTAFLMVGNLSQELKTFAMTMFEMGKLTHEMMSEFLDKLSEITEHDEGEAKHYYTNAMNLLRTLRFLREKNDTLTQWYGQTSEYLTQIPVDMIHNESLKNLSRTAMLKHFSNKYIILISMAPLSNIISPVSCSNPPFFGPSISELSSFWYKLFIYHSIKSGPPTILIPRGSILIVVPKIFKGFENLYIISPEQPASIIPRAHCLHIINDLLKHGCVLIQGFSYDQDCSNKLFHISFPFDESIFLKNEKIYQMILFLKKEHNITNGFGVLTLIKIEKITSLKRRDTILSECSHKTSGSTHSIYDNNLPDSFYQNNSTFCFEDAQVITPDNIDNVVFNDDKFDFLPFEISYGMPLFNNDLNEAICFNIRKNRLFSVESVNQYTLMNRKLILKICDFITQFEGSQSEFFANKFSACYEKNTRFNPTKCVAFYKDKSFIWNIHDEL